MKNEFHSSGCPFICPLDAATKMPGSHSPPLSGFTIFRKLSFELVDGGATDRPDGNGNVDEKYSRNASNGKQTLYPPCFDIGL